MINLTKTNQAAIDFVTNFINSNWLEQGDGTYRYQNIGYPNVKNPADEFRGFFVQEQNGICCYCCRTITNDRNTELEHVIPRAAKDEEEFQPYYDLSEILRVNVVPQKNFVTATEELPKPPFPHHIAYHNIVASCNGRTIVSTDNFTCCNRVRGNDFLPPFNLMPDSIAYLPDGSIVYLKDIRDRTPFELLNLNKEILVNIRRLWFLFSQSDLPTTEITSFGLERLFEKIIEFAIANSNTVTEDRPLADTFSKPEFWNVFIKYYYFGEYFRNN